MVIFNVYFLGVLSHLCNAYLDRCNRKICYSDEIIYQDKELHT